MRDENTRPVPFADELIRPFIVATFGVVMVVHLATQPPDRFAGALWTLAVLVAVTGLLSASPWPVTAGKPLTCLVFVTAIGGAALAALAQDTIAVGFMFLNSAVAGERLSSRSAALAAAATGTVASVIAELVATALLHVNGNTPWWLSLSVGLPVYFGLARKDRAHAMELAEFAASETRRAAASEAREAALEERGRIAREIHDVLGHALSGITLQLDTADALLTAGRAEDAQRAVRRARGLAGSGIGETRRAVHALREDTLPLPETIARLADAADAGYTTTGEPGTLRVETAQTVIRTAQEAITNAHRHAPGGDVRIDLEFDTERVRLTVTDTGAAGDADPGGQEGSGMGLVGMRERAELAGGTLRAGAAEPPSRGWAVRLELPR